MDSTITKRIAGIIIVIIIVFVVYGLLPSRYKDILDSKITMLTDKKAKEIITMIQEQKVPNGSKTFYQATKDISIDGAWLYDEVDSDNGKYVVSYSGYDATLDINDPSGESKLYMKAKININFSVKKNEKQTTWETNVYVNNKLLNDEQKKEFFDLIESK